MDSKILQDIEKALNKAKNNLEHLKVLEELLQQFIAETKQEESKIADVITAKFTDCMASLNSRKRKIEAELVMNTSYYVTDIHSIQVAVIQKRSNLIDAIKKAKELKTTHSLESYHSLNQALCNLNVSVEEEVLKLDNLKKRTLPRFYMDYDEINHLFENIGKFSYDASNVYNFEENSLKKNNELGTSHQVNVNLVKEVDVIPPSKESDICFGGAHLQAMSLLSIQKHTPALSHATSTPDVIIEEIIEDDQETFSAEYRKSTYQKSFFQTQQVPFELKADVPEYVIVSCVINPCHFYVRKVSQKKTAIYLEKVLKHYCRNNSLSPIDILELGTRILVKSKEHGMWCRAEIIELIPLLNKNKEKPCGLTKLRICDIAIMKVFLIDFGHPEALIISRVPNEVTVNPEHVTLKYMMIEDLCLVVRKMDLSLENRLRGISKLALQCSLKGIVPKDSEKGWGRRARTEFLRMVNSKAVLMKIFREENGVLIVDLMKPPANKISSDMPVSLRDALVFLDLASFQNEFSDWSKNTVPLEYYPPVLPRENTEVAAVVSYINSPGDFYIQLLEQGPEFAAFLKKVEEVYESEAGPDLQILCPTHGQPCVAKFEDDGVWYRAQVIGLPGHQEVEVKYVDYGNTAKINIKEMRKIKDEFLVLPEKAIRCKLAYIKPCKEATEWTVQSKDRFEQLIQDKCMLCFVTEKSEDNVLSVELYQSVRVSPKQSGSVNNLLVKEGLASYIIGNNKMIVTPYNEKWDPDMEDIFKTEKFSLKLEIEDLPQMEDLVLESNKELQVQINHIVSPSKIFVHFMLSEKILKRLQEKMIATYSETENKAIKWEVDMNCAAYICEQNQWQRGQIIRIVSEKVVEVFLIDLGIIKTLDITCLRELEQNLKTIRPLAVECSLTNIRPSGGTEQWTATACDVLKSYLTGAVVNLIIQDTNLSPLPVTIFCKHEQHCTDVSEYMIQEGLALRKRTPKIDPNQSSSDELQKNVDINKLVSEKESPSKLEKHLGPSDTDSKQQELNMSVAKPLVVEAYKPPALPTVDCFSAVVSCVSDNGTIYAIPTSQEQKLKELMCNIQDNVKGLGLLKSYNWKSGEACVVRAADTMWYRGEIKEVGAGIVRVHYVDYGYTEKIPPCHLYPTILYAEIPPFSIPCHLYKTVPVGNIWQHDAVELLKELLTRRSVKIRIMEQSNPPWGKVSVKLWFSGMSLSYFMAFHKHCITEDDGDSMPTWDSRSECSNETLEENCEISYEGLLKSELKTPLLPPYISPSLPILGEHFPVKVTHIVSPNEVYLSIVHSNSTSQQRDMEDSLDSDTLDKALAQYNQNIESLPHLTDVRKDMPCLAEYSDGLLYRAKLISILEFNPVSVLVEFVDYGSTKTLPISRLRQIPCKFMQYPTQAFRVLLAGFKPALHDSTTERIPYCPEWSLDALWAAMNCFESKNLSASSVTHSPEHIVFLYEEGRLFHMKLVEMGFAELTQ
ncbi:RING finger protein 17 [Pantherophis guttatus]|uniref:RING finger protein 17 n=1 Tax=Pantherophis guttatus TaxID=94885 RepID=A0A6P9BCP0_PANGU|nr:RING finger protein 17 [Pantherophis guttatus]XP_060542209.1 RING finger protein 17 [Pantherophis guttatus]XP_060542210.1 RING finger protein 17 [Pantherophis guttatus]XP_060542211.1 RING finger protein 17 [Pantherophis guttatus]